MSGFPLYRFPVVVLRELFQQLSLPEIFNISICSKKSQGNVEFLMRKGKSLEVGLNATENCMISVQRNEEHFHVKVAEFSELREKPEVTTHVSINGESVTVAIIGQTLFVTDKKRVLKEVTKHVLKVFRCQLQEARIGNYCSSHIPTWVVDLINEQQGPIESLWVDAKNPSVKDISHLFTKAKVSDELICLFEYTSKGPRPAIKMGKMSMKRFDNHSSSWMTIEHMLNLSFETGTLSESSFKSKDLSRFLEHWMAGGCDRLQELCIETEGFINYSEMLRGIEHELISPDDIRTYNSKVYKNTVGICGGTQIRRRSDGRIARLVNVGTLSKSFSLVVFE
ncbi:hypothetical protein CAEBREN_20113 [Caenorhabditis brenneri]|uniref:F-box domain-containing protein n=1 Tax=Caenorhabditis brenneri TaxID=135651 RepID=G0NCB9_CAEBE|nr:hypothetical protein CAEBREN_20113 [Caenorhabditis brenneri]